MERFPCIDECAVKVEHRLPCGSQGAGEVACRSMGCCYATSSDNIPCYQKLLPTVGKEFPEINIYKKVMTNN